MAQAVPLLPNEKLYRIGINGNCPMHQLYVGGQCFPRHTEKVSGYGSDTQRDKVRGAVTRMGPGQLEACIAAAKHKVIRSTKGRKSRARLHDKRSRNFRPMPGDQPILNFMYAVELDSIENPYLDSSYPTLDSTAGKLTPAVKAAEVAEKKAEADFVAPEKTLNEGTTTATEEARKPMRRRRASTPKTDEA